MRDINYIVIHEADCPLHKPNGSEFTITDIDQWHVERGFRRSAAWRAKQAPELKACGYHYVIGVTGQLWQGRHEDEIPAAVKGFNAVSVDICLIGQGKYTLQQWTALKGIVTKMQTKYPAAAVVGHCFPAFASGKTCPDFNVPVWVAGGMEPAKGHVA